MGFRKWAIKLNSEVSLKKKQWYQGRHLYIDGQFRWSHFGIIGSSKFGSVKIQGIHSIYGNGFDTQFDQQTICVFQVQYYNIKSKIILMNWFETA